jgi:hypothetical protein
LPEQCVTKRSAVTFTAFKKGESSERRNWQGALKIAIILQRFGIIFLPNDVGHQSPQHHNYNVILPLLQSTVNRFYPLF